MSHARGNPAAHVEYLGNGSGCIQLVFLDEVHSCLQACVHTGIARSTTAAGNGFTNLEGHGQQSERCRMGTPNTCLSAKLASQSCSVSLDLPVTHALSDSSAGGRHSCL